MNNSCDVLIIHPDYATRMEISAVAVRCGLRWIAVEDAEAGCRVLQWRPCGAIVCALDLGKYSAISLMQALRRSRMKIPFLVLIDGDPDEPAGLEARLEADGWVSNPRDLASALTGILRPSRLAIPG